MSNQNEWLNDSDPSIQYRYHRDILKARDSVLIEIQNTMLEHGWGYELMKYQMGDYYWDNFYSPKWTSTHYTLQTLRWLNYPKKQAITSAIKRVLKEEKSKDGGISPLRLHNESDCCVTGMVLNYASYYDVDCEYLKSIIDYLILAQGDDGGFNCNFTREKVKHSAFNSSLCVIEGLWEYEYHGYNYRLNEVKKIREEAEEFLLIHHLYLSDKTLMIIDKKYLSMHFPFYWRYDILRALDYFAYSNHTYDIRLDKAINWLSTKQKDNQWKLSSTYVGKVYFNLELAGKLSKINTVRALNVINHFNQEQHNGKTTG